MFIYIYEYMYVLRYNAFLRYIYLYHVLYKQNHVHFLVLNYFWGSSLLIHAFAYSSFFGICLLISTMADSCPSIKLIY